MLCAAVDRATVVCGWAWCVVVVGCKVLAVDGGEAECVVVVVVDADAGLAVAASADKVWWD